MACFLCTLHGRFCTFPSIRAVEPACTLASSESPGWAAALAEFDTMFPMVDASGCVHLSSTLFSLLGALSVSASLALNICELLPMLLCAFIVTAQEAQLVPCVRSSCQRCSHRRWHCLHDAFFMLVSWLCAKRYQDPRKALPSVLKEGRAYYEARAAIHNLTSLEETLQNFTAEGVADKVAEPSVPSCGCPQPSTPSWLALKLLAVDVLSACAPTGSCSRAPAAVWTHDDLRVSRLCGSVSPSHRNHLLCLRSEPGARCVNGRRDLVDRPQRPHCGPSWVCGVVRQAQRAGARCVQRLVGPRWGEEQKPLLLLQPLRQ